MAGRPAFHPSEVHDLLAHFQPFRRSPAIGTRLQIFKYFNEILLRLAYVGRYHELHELLVGYGRELNLDHRSTHSRSCALVQCVQGADPATTEEEKEEEDDEEEEDEDPRVQCLQLLVKSGADVGCRDGRGRTALHWAAAMGRGDLVRTLMHLGGDPRAEEKDGHTVLQLAIKAGHLDCMDILVDEARPMRPVCVLSCTVWWWWYKGRCAFSCKMHFPKARLFILSICGMWFYVYSIECVIWMLLCMFI